LNLILIITFKFFLTSPCQGSDLSFLGRYISIIWKKRFDAGDGGVAQKVANFPEGLLCPMPRQPLMVRAALLRRSCDGVAAATELRRPAPSRSSCASRPRWSLCCCDGADAARSAAATESLLRRSRCCDGDAQTSSVALILRVASRRDALNEEPASFPPG